MTDEMRYTAGIYPEQERMMDKQFTASEVRELLRLTDENARLLAANRDAMDHFEQMKAELTIAHHERDRMFLDAREWATRFGEMEARAERAEAELAALKERIAVAPITMLHLAHGYLPDSMRKSGLAPNTRIALVPVDD